MLKRAADLKAKKIAEEKVKKALASFKKHEEELKKAKYRLYFDRLLKVQLQSWINKQQYLANPKPLVQKEEIDRELIKTFVSRLPFQLTDAQKKVIKQMIEDFNEDSAILRLLQ